MFNSCIREFLEPSKLQDEAEQFLDYYKERHDNDPVEIWASDPFGPLNGCLPCRPEQQNHASCPSGPREGWILLRYYPPERRTCWIALLQVLTTPVCHQDIASGRGH